MKIIVRRILFALLCGFCLALPAKAAPTLSAVVRQIVCDCSDCGKQTVDQCMSTCGRGKELAAEIKAHIEAGKGETQILEFMSIAHGEDILAVPNQNNFLGKMAPWAPFLILLAGVVPIVYITRTRQRKVKMAGPKRAPQKPKVDDEKLSEALKTFDY